jgi:hypothetical protein
MDEGQKFFRDLLENESLFSAIAAFNRPRHDPCLFLFSGHKAAGHKAAGYMVKSGENGGLRDSEEAKLYDEPDKEAQIRLSAFLTAKLAARPSLWRYFPAIGDLPDFWDFEPEPYRLALLPDPEFDELALKFGAAVWGEEFAKIIDGQAVRSLREALGQPLLAFALNRGRYWLGELAAIYRQGQNAPRDRESLKLTGLNAINVAWGDLPENLGSFIGGRVYKDPLPKRSAANLAARTFEKLKSLLLKEVAPSWRNCFS